MRSRLIAAFTGLALGACSSSLPGAAEIRSGAAGRCSTSTARPSGDLVLAAIGAAFVGIAAEGNLNDDGRVGEDEFSPEVKLLVFGLPGALMLLSGGAAAYHGFTSVGACKERNALSRTATP